MIRAFAIHGAQAQPTALDQQLSEFPRVSVQVKLRSLLDSRVHFVAIIHER